MARSTSKPLVEAQMISLADIAFLIIFFFMLTSQFMKDRTKVDLPRLPQATKAKTPIMVSMTKNSIIVDGKQVDTPENVESALRTLLSGRKPEEMEVRFRCDKNLTYKEYNRVQAAISNAGGVICIMVDVHR